MADKDDEIIDHIKQDLDHIKEDFDELAEQEALERDIETLKRFADDISQLGEDAEEGKSVYEIEGDAGAISTFLNAPLWGNISLLHAADSFDEIDAEKSLFYDIVEEFFKHPEQYQQLFGQFETMLRRFNDRHPS